jgi:DNA-directed RNA polymerase subunit H (RpoH/RPB5)
MQKNKEAFEVKEHFLVPKHSKMSDKDKKEFLEKHNINLLEMPKIMIDDPAISHLEVKEGDIVKIERRSSTSGTSLFYRCVRNA